MALEDLVRIHREVMAGTETKVKRYLYDKIDWNGQAICIVGDRGVGKTTLICQRLIEKYGSVEEALYISADNIHVTSEGLFNIAESYFSGGGEALFIDEVHKYPNWSVELKNIIDTYKKKRIVFSASSSLDLNRSKGDLSRRVVYHTLKGLSFREYLLLACGENHPVLSFDEILKNHLRITESMANGKMVKNYKAYLQHGYYPFFLEGVKDYSSRLNNVVEKVIYEDIALVFNLKHSTLPVLKKILWLVATTDGLTPNIEKISGALGVSREVVYFCLEYLNKANLLTNIYPSGEGIKLLRKPSKIYMNNSNLLFLVNGTLSRQSGVGGVRETFFANQVGNCLKLNTASKGDFLVEDRFYFEVGGKNKDFSQIKNVPDSYLALDDIEVGFKNKIPLYLFGFLY